MGAELYSVCKLCHSPNLRLLFISGHSGLPIQECRACGLAFVGKSMGAAEQSALYNQQQDYEIYARAEHSVPELPQRHREWIELIERHLNRKRNPAFQKRMPRLLDIGCGAGDFLAAAADMEFEVHGQEISMVAARLAREWHAIDVDVVALAEYPIHEFDVVTLIGLVEHVVDPRVVLLEASRLLAPGGLMYLYTPVWGAYDVISSFVARVSGGRLSRPIDRRINQWHLQLFPKFTLVRLLAELGFETLACETVCEYNLPIHHYLQAIGVTQPRLVRLTASTLKGLIDRKLFFRNNMQVVARKLNEGAR
jgi:2-polyprenyl-3-methyl-5-hydroxy-6-metoxy-1,4-benzoquinol methylase